MNIMLSIFFTALLAICAGCYRMPDENDFSTVPTTNNPAITCEKPEKLIPGLGY